MTEVGYVSALVLAGVMTVAATAKLRAPRTATASFTALGLPGAKVLARAIPMVEIAVAILLVATPRPAGVAAALLLVAFTVPLVRVLAHGDSVGCGCFGSSATTTISSIDIVRNGLLIALAVLATGATRTVPGLAPVVLVTTAAVLGAAGLAFARLVRTSGSPFRIRLLDAEETA